MADSFQAIATFDEKMLEPLHELQVEGEPSFVGGLLADYLSQVDDLSAKILAAENASDKPALERAAHKLKSSSAVLGLAKVAAICRAIEEGARFGRPTSEEVKILPDAIDEATQTLNRYLLKLA